MKAKSGIGTMRVIHRRIMSLFRTAIGLRLNKIYVGADRPDMLEASKFELPPGYTSRLCSKEDLLPFVEDGIGLSAEFLEAAYAKGDDGIAAFYDDELVAYKFAARGRVQLTQQLDAIVPEGFRTTYKAWTHMEHRRKNLTNHLSYKLGNACWDRNYRERAIWYIETTNYASRLHGHLNPKIWSLSMGYFGWITLFGREIPFNSRWAKRIGFMAVAKSDTQVRLYAD